MSHYPIKCIRCAYVANNNTVLFDTSDTNLGMRDMLAQDHASIEPQAEISEEKSSDSIFGDYSVEGGNIWGDSTNDADSIWSDSMDSGGKLEMKNTKNSSAMERYMTYPKIKAYCKENGLNAPEPKWQKVVVTPDYKNTDNIDIDEELLVSVSYQKVKDGPYYKCSKRYCPACKCELPAQSGAMPTFNVTVIGTSASGKTVYLCALNWLLSNAMGNLPFNSRLTCISANRMNNDLISKSNALFERGILPGTTQIVLTEPLVVQMTYSIGGVEKKCLFSMADMRGEDFVAEDGENLIARGEFFAHADAFMMLISPLNMPYIKNLLPDIQTGTDLGVHGSLMANINDYILPNFENGIIDVPCVVMLSKSDILMKRAAELKIPPNNPVIAAEPGVKFTKTYFKNQNMGTKYIMSCDPTLLNYVNNIFPRAYFTSFSSLGVTNNIEIDENGNQIISNNNLIKPIRVINPVIHILISLGFLPRFNEMEAGEQYAQKNRDILNEWRTEKTASEVN